MKIVSIFAPYLYAIQYDNTNEDSYTSLLNDWQDIDSFYAYLLEQEDNDQ